MYIYIYTHILEKLIRAWPTRAQGAPQGQGSQVHRGSHTGPAHKGPGPTRAWPTRAQEGPQGPCPRGPRGPTRARSTRSQRALKPQPGPGGQKGPAHKGLGV